MKVKFLGTHNAESKETNLASFLIDGVLAVDAGSIASELTFDEQAKVKAILLSHGHYDHIRELPAFAFNNSGRVTNVYGVRDTIQIFSSHLADGLIYPEFVSEKSYLAKSVLQMCEITPLKAFKVLGYQVLPVPVQHPIEAVGFEITRGGRSIFYTGDTGASLSAIWEHVSPHLLIADMTYPNRMRNVALDAGHLCPELLEEELKEFKRIKGYLPSVTLVHISPPYKDEIERDVKAGFKGMKLTIGLAREGDEITV